MKVLVSIAVFSMLLLVACGPRGYDNLSPEEFAARINDPEVVVLDVRTPQETAQGMIKGALAIDYRSDEFSERVSQLDTTKVYLVYCRSGNRSSKSCRLMSKLGFRQLYNLDGGYQAWQRSQD